MEGTIRKIITEIRNKPFLSQQTDWGTLTYNEEIVVLQRVSTISIWLTELIEQANRCPDIDDEALKKLLDASTALYGKSK